MTKLISKKSNHIRGNYQLLEKPHDPALPVRWHIVVVADRKLNRETIMARIAGTLSENSSIEQDWGSFRGRVDKSRFYWIYGRFDTNAGEQAEERIRALGLPLIRDKNLVDRVAHATRHTEIDPSIAIVQYIKSIYSK